MAMPFFKTEAMPFFKTEAMPFFKDARKHDTHRGSGVYLTVVCADTTTGCNMAASGVGAIRCKGRTRALRDVHHGP